MKRYFKIATAAAITIALSGAGIFAYATGAQENDALAINQAKITLSQAIAAAEQHDNGKASKAEYEQSKSGWEFDVEVVSGAKVFDVKVNAETGKVISSVEDKKDHDDDHDTKD